MGLPRLRWTCLLALLLPVAAFATTVFQDGKPRGAWKNIVASKMEAIGSADSLTASALLLHVTLAASDPDKSTQDEQSWRRRYTAASRQLDTVRLQLLDRAAALDPDAADIAALALRVCVRMKDCDLAARVKNLHLAAPKDGEYMIPVLIRAQRESDELGVDRILQTLAEATTFNRYYFTISKRTRRAVSQSSDWPEPPPFVGAPQDFDAKEEIISAAASYIYELEIRGITGSINVACKESNPHFADRRGACRSIGLALSHSSSPNFARTGLELWQRTARNASDLAAARRASLRLDWRLETLADAIRSGTIDPRLKIPSFAHNGGTLPGVVALLMQHGLPTKPPKGWTSQREKFELEWVKKREARELGQGKQSVPSALNSAGEWQKVSD